MKILKKWLKNTKNSWISWKWHQIKKWRNPNTAWHRSSPPWFDCLAACNLPTSCSHHYNKDRDELDHRKDGDDRRSLQTILSTKSHIPLSRIEEYKDLEVMAKSYHITAFYRGKIFFLIKIQWDDWISLFARKPRPLCTDYTSNKHNWGTNRCLNQNWKYYSYE